MNAVFQIELLVPGVVLVTFQERADVSEADALQIVRDIRDLTGRELHGNIIDIRPLTYMSRETRTAFARAEAAEVVGIAIIVSTSVHRGLGNFYLTVLRPRVPTRLFESQADAVQWIRELVGKHRQLAQVR